MTQLLSSNDPWKTDELTFPRSGRLQDQLAFCVNYAVLAPSIHNTQPWLFRPLDDAIEIFADRSRQLPVTDPDGREMMISCGAALTNLIIAINHFGYEGWVQYRPEPGNPDLLARVRIGRSRVADHWDESLFRSILRRRSVRRPFQLRPIPRDLQRRLIWLASEYTCWVHFVESEADRSRIATFVEEAHHQQLQNPAYQAERSSWIGSGDHRSRNGSTRGSSDETGAPDVTRSTSDGAALETGKVWQERDRDLIQSSPSLFVLGTSGDSPLDWLRAGEAIQRIILLIESDNISASFLNQPCQIPELREQVRRMSGRSGPPQLILRIGYNTGVGSPTSRRPTSDVIMPQQP